MGDVQPTSFAIRKMCYGLVDLCQQECLTFVLGHALAMKGLHGGKAQNAWELSINKLIIA